MLAGDAQSKTPRTNFQYIGFSEGLGFRIYKDSCRVFVGQFWRNTHAPTITHILLSPSYALSRVAEQNHMETPSGGLLALSTLRKVNANTLRKPPTGTGYPISSLLL